MVKLCLQLVRLQHKGRLVVHMVVAELVTTGDGTF